MQKLLAETLSNVYKNLYKFLKICYNERKVNSLVSYDNWSENDIKGIRF